MGDMIIGCDQDLLTQVILVLPGLGGDGGGKTVIPFQFPAIVKSDNKSGDWYEFAQRMAEPLPFYKGGKPREITLKWTYIVNGQVTNGIRWDVGNVSKYIKKCRAYFYNKVGTQLIIRFRAYEVVGGSGTSVGYKPGQEIAGSNQKVNDPSTWTFRAESLSVDHSDAMIREVGSRAYPLRTDLTMRLKFQTKLTLGNNASKSVKADPDDESDKEPKVKFDGLEDLPKDLVWL